MYTNECCNSIDTKNNSKETVRNVFSPAIEIEESSDFYRVRMDIPGVEKDNIKIHIVDNELVVNANQELCFNENAVVIFGDAISKEYHKEFSLGNDIDKENIDAKYERGVLTLTFQKKSQFQPKEIPIQ